MIGSAAIGMFLLWIALVRGTARLLRDLHGGGGEVAMAWSLMAIPLAGLALVYRGRFVRLDPRVQWTVSAIVASGSLVALILFFRSI